MSLYSVSLCTIYFFRFVISKGILTYVLRQIICRLPILVQLFTVFFLYFYQSLYNQTNHGNLFEL